MKRVVLVTTEDRKHKVSRFCIWCNRYTSHFDRTVRKELEVEKVVIFSHVHVCTKCGGTMQE